MILTALAAALLAASGSALAYALVRALTSEDSTDAERVVVDPLDLEGEDDRPDVEPPEWYSDPFAASGLPPGVENVEDPLSAYGNRFEPEDA
jgi:hypothetical protein